MAPPDVVTSAIDGASIILADVFAAHALTVLLFDGPAPTSDSYKRLVAIALDIAARWDDRVAVHIITRRNDRPFEIPCAVNILFDDHNTLTAYVGNTDRAYIIDTKGLTTLRLEPPDAASVISHLASTLDR